MVEAIVKKVRVTAAYIPAGWFKVLSLSAFETAVADAIADERKYVELVTEKGVSHAFDLRDELLSVPFGGNGRGFVEVEIIDRHTCARHIISLTPFMERP